MNFLKDKNLDFNKIQEAVVLFAIACLTISYFGGYYLWITTIGHHSTLLREIAVVLLTLKLVTTRYNKKEFAIVTALLLLAVANFKVSGNTRAMYNILMLCALKNVELKKVFQISLASVVFIVVVMATLALTGVTGTVSVTENFGRGDAISEIETRFYMGYIHPNTWAQAMFAMMTMLVAVFYKRIDWKGILLVFTINYMVYRLAVSRTCFIAGMVLVVLLFLGRYAKRFYDFLLIRIGIIGGVTALWAIIFTVHVDVVNNIKWQIVDWKLFTGRIRQAQAYYQLFGTSFFGRNIPDQLENGYILDMGYMRMLLENGVIIFALMYLSVIALLIYAMKKRRNDIIIITICICLYGIYENQAIAQVPANLMVYYMANMLYRRGKIDGKERYDG